MVRGGSAWSAMRSVALFGTVIAVLAHLGSTAAAQEEPSPVPPVFVPQYVDDKVPDVRQRHPWTFGHEFPLMYTYVRGTWKWPNGSDAFVYCLIAVAADNPNWQQEDMRYMRFTGGARCNYQMADITANVRLLPGTGEGQLAGQSEWYPQAQVAPDDGVPQPSWQAYGRGYYTRTSDTQLQRVAVQITITLPDLPNANWDFIGANPCQRADPQYRVVNCDVYSGPFTHPPYPCPNGFVGAQPAGCTTADGAVGSSLPDTPDEPDADLPNHDDPAGLYQGDDDPYAGTNTPLPDEEGFPGTAQVSSHAGNFQCAIKPRYPARSTGLGPYTVHGRGTQICDPPVARQSITVCLQYIKYGAAENDPWLNIDCRGKSKVGSGTINAYPRGPCPLRHAKYRTQMFGDVTNAQTGRYYASGVHNSTPVHINC